MIVYALALHWCTTIRGPNNPADIYSTSCEYKNSNVLYASEKSCKQGGDLEVAKGVILDDFYGVTHSADKFLCSQVDVLP